MYTFQWGVSVYQVSNVPFGKTDSNSNLTRPIHAVESSPASPVLIKFTQSHQRLNTVCIFRVNRGVKESEEGCRLTLPALLLGLSGGCTKLVNYLIRP